MKHIATIGLLLFTSFFYSQKFQTSKIVADAFTKLPLENVIVYNELDKSITNIEGKFIFISQNKEINLNLLGYEPIKTSSEILNKTKDTIFMQIQATQLNEVVVSNASAFMQKVYAKAQENSLQDYTIDLFLRNTLKKENEYVVLQDMCVRKNHNPIQKKKTSLEILNLRKIKLSEKKDHIDFRFCDFDEVFRIQGPEIEKANFKEEVFPDSNFKKILFETNEKDKNGQVWKGYFIVNRSDYGVVAYYQDWISNPEAMPYQKAMLFKTQYRTVKGTKLIKFSKDLTSNKYYPNSLKLESNIEILTPDKTFYYYNNLDYFVTNYPNKQAISSNFPTDKDIFKANFDYNADFWKNQNQLPLTKELEEFLKSAAEKKDKTKEYKFSGNF